MADGARLAMRLFGYLFAVYAILAIVFVVMVDAGEFRDSHDVNWSRLGIIEGWSLYFYQYFPWLVVVLLPAYVFGCGACCAASWFRPARVMALLLGLLATASVALKLGAALCLTWVAPFEIPVTSVPMFLSEPLLMVVFDRVEWWPLTAELGIMYFPIILLGVRASRVGSW